MAVAAGRRGKEKATALTLVASLWALLLAHLALCDTLPSPPGQESLPPISSYRFSQDQCREGIGEWKSEGEDDVFGTLVAAEAERGRLTACPRSVGLAFLERDVGHRDDDASETVSPSCAVQSTRNSSGLTHNLGARAAAGRASQSVRSVVVGLFFEIWLTFSEESLEDWGKEEAIFAIGAAGGGSEGLGTAAGSSCSLSWDPFSFQLRQRGPFIIAETRWETYGGRPVCRTVQTGVLPEGDETSESFSGAPHHLVVTLEQEKIGGSENSSNQSLDEALSSPAAASSGGSLSLYLDGQVLSREDLSLSSPAQKEGWFFETWNEAHHLVFGLPSVFNTSWVGTIHAVSTFASPLSHTEVKRRHEGWSGIERSEPVGIPGERGAEEDELTLLRIESFDFDAAFRPQNAAHNIEYFITKTVGAGRLVDAKTGGVVEASEGKPYGLGRGTLFETFQGEEEGGGMSASKEGGGGGGGEALASQWGRTFAKVGFAPERDDFSPPALDGSDRLQPYASFRYMACDFGGSSDNDTTGGAAQALCSEEETVYIVVAGSNDAPVGLNSTGTVRLGETSLVTFLGSDADGAADISGVEVLSLPGFGTLSECSLDEETGKIQLGAEVVAEAMDGVGMNGSSHGGGYRLNSTKACYTFTGNERTLDGLRRGSRVIAMDAIAFRMVDTQNATSEGVTRLAIEVLNPLVGENRTVSCEEEGRAWVNLTFADARGGAANREDLGFEILSLPRFGSLFYPATPLSSSQAKDTEDVHASAGFVPAHQGKQPSTLLGTCQSGEASPLAGDFGARACVSLLYVPIANYFNAPDLLAASNAQLYKDLGLDQSASPEEGFAYAVTSASAEGEGSSVNYTVNIKVNNVEDEAEVLAPTEPLVGEFLNPVAIVGLAVTDPDRHLDLYLVDLDVTAGLLDIAEDAECLNYLKFLMGDGHGDRKMIFRGVLPKVNECLGELTYTALSRSGEDRLLLRAKDMDTEVSSIGDAIVISSQGFPSYSRTVNITIRDAGGSEAGGKRAKRREICAKSLGLCVAEETVYGVLLLILLLMFFGPVLYWAYRLVAAVLCCRLRPGRGMGGPAAIGEGAFGLEGAAVVNASEIPGPRRKQSATI